MSKAVVLQHVPYEGPGRIQSVFRDFGIPVEIRHLYAGDAVPVDLDDVRILVVMGGPMGVGDIAGRQFPFLSDEVSLLQKRIAADRPTLGICLGAQLIAHAAGAKVYPNVRPLAVAPQTPTALPEIATAAKSPTYVEQNASQPPTALPEIGWGPVTFPFPGGTEPVVFGLHDGARMFHWHFDTFDLPKLPAPANLPSPPAPAPPTGNALLSSTRICRNQAFRFKNRIFGFQYHFEMTPEGIEGMLQHGEADVLKVLGPDGAAKIRRDTAEYYQGYERLGNRVIVNLVEFLKLH